MGNLSFLSPVDTEHTAKYGGPATPDCELGWPPWLSLPYLSQACKDSEILAGVLCKNKFRLLGLYLFLFFLRF